MSTRWYWIILVGALNICCFFMFKQIWGHDLIDPFFGRWNYQTAVATATKHMFIVGNPKETNIRFELSPTPHVWYCADNELTFIFLCQTWGIVNRIVVSLKKGDMMLPRVTKCQSWMTSCYPWSTDDVEANLSSPCWIFLYVCLDLSVCLWLRLACM